MALYNLFISHSWAYGDAYEKVCEMLDSQVSTYGFNYKNYSVPKNDPIHNAPNEAVLRAAIRAQIQPAREFNFEVQFPIKNQAAFR
uniref:TIR domain-containing protein n=1 Tax=Aeromonas caviae TaxID=648 RepID=UPI002B4A3F49